MSDHGDESETLAAPASARSPASATAFRKKTVTTSLSRGRRVRFELLKIHWKLRMLLRRFGLFVRRHAGTVRRTLMVFAGVALGMVADAFGAGDIPKGDLANYLVATGAMIGGTTAIVFSISLFLLQGVSDMYSSRHLEDYVNRWRDQLIFPAIILITLVFFAGALYVASQSTMSSDLASTVIAVSLFFVGVVFGLIDYQYEAVRARVSPAKVIGFLRAKAQGSLRLMKHDAAHIAEIVRVPADGMTTDEALAVAYNGVLASVITDLGQQTERLVDIALRLAERQEVEMARLSQDTCRHGARHRSRFLRRPRCLQPKATATHFSLRASSSSIELA